MVLIVVAAPAQAQYPAVSLMATRVIERYLNSICEQLWAVRGKKPRSQEPRVLDLLNGDPGMRQAFFSQIGDSVMRKSTRPAMTRLRNLQRPEHHQPRPPQLSDGATARGRSLTSAIKGSPP